MALTVRHLSERLAEHLRLQLPDWRQSVYPVELMPYDTRPSQHLCWAIGLATSQVAALDRRRVNVGTHTSTTVQVAWAYRLRDDGIVHDQDLAYDAEAALVAALLTIDQDPDLGVQLERMSRRVVPGEGSAILLGTVDLICHHRLPLA